MGVSSFVKLWRVTAGVVTAFAVHTHAYESVSRVVFLQEPVETIE
jgi:hypothetical protein